MGRELDKPRKTVARTRSNGGIKEGDCWQVAGQSQHFANTLTQERRAVVWCQRGGLSLHQQQQQPWFLGCFSIRLKHTTAGGKVTTD